MSASVSQSKDVSAAHHAPRERKMNELVSHDRGLGTAYERYCIYQMLESFRTKYDIESVLEGPIDGMAGVPGVHGVGFARQGIPVHAFVPSEAQAQITRGVYQRAGGGNAKVEVMSDLSGLSRLPKADLVIAYHALGFVPDWRAYLDILASRARKAFVVAVCNPRNWGVTFFRAVGKLRGIPGMTPPEFWKSEVLGPALWELGRVREHVYFDCPWWPDMPVYPGQSLTSRIKGLWTSKASAVTFEHQKSGDELARKFIYGPEKWPYFGGDGWYGELLPALLRHPTFEGTSERVRERTGHLHAFLVDRTPRTPQERRKLSLIENSN